MLVYVVLMKCCGKLHDVRVFLIGKETGTSSESFQEKSYISIKCNSCVEDYKI